MTAPAKSLRVMVFVSSLGAGGAERVAIRVCGWLRDAGHVVCLLTLSGTDSDFYPCPEGVRRVALDLQSSSRSLVQALWNNIRRIYALRSAVRTHRADAVVTLGASSSVLMLLALVGVQCRKIISERADPARQPLSLGWRLLRRLAYPMSSLHVSQSSYASLWLRRQFPKLPCIIIGNTAGRVPGDCLSEFGSERKPDLPLRLISVGRLTYEKGVNFLLSALAAAREISHLPIELVIVGDGEDRARLLKQADILGLSAKVSFIGKVSNIWDHLNTSHIYVLPSLWEGFPNAMIEAMAAGLPVIAARCQGGVEDVLGDVPGRFALEFAPGDVAALTDAIVTLAASAEHRQRLSAAARNRAADYNPERIAEKWLRAVEG